MTTQGEHGIFLYVQVWNEVVKLEDKADFLPPDAAHFFIPEAGNICAFQQNMAAGRRRQTGNSVFTFPFIRSPPAQEKGWQLSRKP